MVSGPLADHGCPVCYTWKGLMVMCVGGGAGGGVTTQELICLSLKGQQEIGLSCPDDRWPLWRQSRFKLLPGPFENTSAPLEWLAIWATVPSRSPPLCQAWGVGGMSGKHGSLPQLPYSSHLVSSISTVCPNTTTRWIYSILIQDFPFTLHTFSARTHINHM